MRFIRAPEVLEIRNVYRDLQKMNGANGERLNVLLKMVDFFDGEMLASREFYDKYGGYRDLGRALSDYLRDLEMARDSVASCFAKTY